MSGNNINRIFLARLAGTAVFDPNGDPVGKVRDAVATLRSNNQPPRILGLVVEVPLRRRVFVPITRVTSIEAGAVVITGLLNMRRFETRTGEMLVLGELLDRSVILNEDSQQVVVEDMAMEQNRTGDWLITRVHIMRKGRGLRRKGATSTVAWEEVSGFTQNESNQGVSNLLSTIGNLRAADLAAVIQDLAPKRRVEVARALDDERLADVLEEMEESERVALLAELEGERAAKTELETHGDELLGLLQAAVERVGDAAPAGRALPLRPQVLEHPIGAAAHMQHHGQTVGAGQPQLRGIKKLLTRTHGGLAQRGNKKVQADFADRHQARIAVVLCQLSVQSRQVGLLGLRHVQGMDAQAVAVTKGMGQFAHRRPVGALYCRYDAVAHACRPRRFTQGAAIGGTFRSVQMGVGVNPHQARDALIGSAQDPAVQPQAAAALGGQGRVVGDQHKSRALVTGELQHQVEHTVGGAAVQVAGGLVGQHAIGPCDQGAGNRHPLAFTP